LNVISNISFSLVKFSMMLEESNTPELPRRCKYLWYSSITCNGWI